METGVWLNFPTTGEFPCCLGEQVERTLPHFGPAAEVLWAVSLSGANSHLHQPLFSPLPCDGVQVLGPPALLSVYEDLKAHLVQCAQEKTGRDLPDLQPEEAGSNLVKVEQCQGKAELRSPKSSTNVLASVSGVEWRRGGSRSQMAARTCWLSWSVVSCLGSKGKNSS